MEIAILFALILLNGVFAMSELALVSARKTRLQKLIDEGDSGAIAAAKLGEDPKNPTLIKTIYGAGYIFLGDVTWV